MENLNQDIPDEYPPQQPTFQPPRSSRKPILIGFLILVFLIGGYSVLAKYHSLWPFQSSKNVNTIEKKLIPFERETGNFFECVESVEYGYPTVTYKKENGKVYFDFFILEGVDYDSFESVDK